MRLIEAYPEQERRYYQKVGYYPAHHIVGLRRDVFERIQRSPSASSMLSSVRACSRSGHACP